MARIKTTLELEDRLSDLPDCLLHHIFGFIDFKYCIRTSVLSKRWKLLWTSLSNLYFDGCDGTRLPDFHRFVLEPFLKKNIAHLESHNMYDVLVLVSIKTYVLKTLELTRCHIRPSESDCKPTWTNLNLHECDFCPQIMFFNPFENCLHLKELRLHKCSISGKAVLNISCPRLVNLVLTDLKLIILAPQPVSFSLTLNRPLNFTALHLPALDNVEIQILSPNNSKTLSFSRLITMLQGLRYARSVKICSKTIEMLTMIPGALEKQSCPFSRLKNEDFESCR
ncbi:hypothetical protein E1A91_A12G226400v1 [Gossypium mustelinum]|uniref:F-box domain-containing protein n=1 Tax=Gossypium mustelinum TaxID=34275 RepID=A0A5D2WXN4_GOSMU|nr:hypothetical protein E1A91_A12G226400v1 [Gossypium mustelinum]